MLCKVTKSYHSNCNETVGTSNIIGHYLLVTSLLNETSDLGSNPCFLYYGPYQNGTSLRKDENSCNCLRLHRNLNLYLCFKSLSFFFQGIYDVELV